MHTHVSMAMVPHWAHKGAVPIPEISHPTATLTLNPISERSITPMKFIQT